MDYRYLLYFDRGARFDALEHLARMAAPTDDGPTTIVLPDRSLELPFGTWGKPRQQISGDDTADAWGFSTVLCFPPDQALDNYLHYFDREGSDNRRYDDLGRLEIGYIDLSVHDVKDTDLVCFAFGTTGSSMSILFMESESIRSALFDLLASCRGVYAVFDMEDFADLIWLRGEERDDRLPTADLSLAQIEELLSPAPAAPPAGPSAPLPLSFAAEQVFAGVRHVRRTAGGSELGVHHWLVALHEHDGDPRATTSRQALASGDIGDPLTEDLVRERAIARARQDGRNLVSLEDVASAIAEAAG